MKKSIIAIVALSLIATSAFANDERNRYHRQHQYYNQNYYNHNNHYNRGHSNNDDWLWAVGGLIVGAAIVNAADKPADPTVSQPLPPPQKRKVTVCSDEVAYNPQGNPYVLRSCYESWQ